MTVAPPILVTGAPRSGTTLLGEALGATRGAAVLFEPFHPDAGVADVPWREFPFRIEFPYVTEGGAWAEPFARLLAEVLAGKARYRRPAGGARQGLLLRLARVALTSRLALRNRAAARQAGARRVIKDPHLALSAAFARRVAGLACLVTVRHPAALAESWRRLGWNPDLRQFWEQPGLWDRHLADLPRPDLERLSPLEKAAHAWLYLYTVLLAFRREEPETAWVRLEDLAAAPAEGVRALYGRFGLPYDDRAAAAVRGLTEGVSAEVGRPGHPHQLRRDSRTVVSGWKARLAPEERRTVRTIAGEVGEQLYPESEWWE